MALVEGCKHSLEITVPASEVEAETERVLVDVQKKAKLPGFRPGKVPAGIIRKQFEGEIRQRVLESLVPKYLNRHFEEENLNVVGSPDISDVHLHEGEPLRFKAEFEVLPSIELGEYQDIEVPYDDPQVTAEDVETRINELRDQKADYINLDPRPLEDGDFAVVALESIAGIQGPPIKNDEMMIEIGGRDTMAGFTENLRGASIGDQKEFDVVYPEDYGHERLAGKTVRFRAAVKGLRRKELPEVNDEFAQDLGDFRDAGELREAVRKSLQAQRQYEAQQEAKNKIVEKLVDMHEFPVPEALVERQVRSRMEQNLRDLAANGVDVSKIRLDWEKVFSSQKDKAAREVKASLLLSRIAEREHIDPTREEVDREIERIAKQQREPFAAVRLRFEKDGAIGRIAHQIRTGKTLDFLFEHARKVAGIPQA
ncbi:MAG: trigger factor [Bryobacteraceae bacterium]